MWIRRKVTILVTLAAIGLAGGGCAGINASHSVSPASFLLPGLLRNEHKQDVHPPAPVQTPEVPAEFNGQVFVAQVR